MKKILNIYNKATGGEILWSVFTVEEFVQVQFKNMEAQAFTYSEYINRVKKAVKDWYFFEDARGEK